MPRTRFISSTFVRLLTELASAEIAESRQSVAERLSLWLDWSDAISLSAALNAAGAAIPPPTLAGGASASAHAVHDEFARVRADLVKAITTDDLFRVDKASMKTSTVSSQPAPDTVMDVPACRRQYLAHQRAMTERIGPLRANVRAALSKHSVALGRLAALDAALDKALATRERHLFSHVPPLLERRLKSHAETGSAFRRKVQHLLLAELDIRLQPIEGMMEAMGHEIAQPA